VNSRRFVFAGLLGLIATIVQPQIGLGYTAEGVGKIAKEVTVMIDAKETTGSGVLISHQGYEYSVLTNWHVLKASDSYTVKTSDGQLHQIRPDSIKQIVGLDLAIGTFSSPKFYRVVELGNSDTIAEGSTLYITGAPSDLKGIDSRSLLVVGGQLVGYNATGSGGYTLIYNNNTMPGMSGGAVMDTNGNLIGIHGRGSHDQKDRKSGFNLGIPINLFVKNANQLGIKYTLDRPRIGQTTIPVSPTQLQGRPRVIEGSEGTNGTCAGERC
jgi:serine protease Do